MSKDTKQEIAEVKDALASKTPKQIKEEIAKQEAEINYLNNKEKYHHKLSNSDDVARDKRLELAGGLKKLYDPSFSLLRIKIRDHNINSYKKTNQFQASKSGQVIANGNGKGNRNDQLTDAYSFVDKSNDSLIIADWGNRRVVRWPRQNGTNGQTIMTNIDCAFLALDHHGDLYVCERENNEVRRWKKGETKGTLVAGGHGVGNQLNQLNQPQGIFVDKDLSIYVSDRNNHHIMKWMKGAKERTVFAGGQGRGDSLTQLSCPEAVTVDHLGNVYVADSGNYRIMRWLKGSKEGSIVVGGHSEGTNPNQMKYPKDLSFDREGNLYVVEWGNARVQKFAIIPN